jgi:hypothetical protein
MRHTQPLTADESSLDMAMRSQRRTDGQCDLALTTYRLARHRARLPERRRLLERTADLLLSGDVEVRP